MAEISLLSESQIETYVSPDRKVRQQVITYQVAGMAPRTIWVESDKLPDVVYRAEHQGKAPPPAVQAQGDAVRRAAIEVELAKIGQAAGPRKI